MRIVISLSLSNSPPYPLLHYSNKHVDRKWDYARKKLLLIIAMPILAAMLILAFVFFYTTQNTSFCSWCHYVDCVEWVAQIDCSAY